MRDALMRDALMPDAMIACAAPRRAPTGARYFQNSKAPLLAQTHAREMGHPLLLMAES
jgi:hypothetical protein